MFLTKCYCIVKLEKGIFLYENTENNDVDDHNYDSEIAQ